MANEELGKLSTEQLNRLAKVFSEVKQLSGQQVEIIEEVLSGEEKIGKRRVAYLEEYFDTYSKNLDKVAHKYAKTTKEAQEFGNARADQIRETAKAKAIEEVKKKLAEKRLQLEFEAREKHNGRLLKKDAAEIEKQLSKEYETRTKNINRLTAAQLKNDQQVMAKRLEAEEQLKALSALKETDPQQAAAFEKKKADRKAELELEAIRRNNGIITKEERSTINKQLNEEFDLRSSRGKALLQELAAKRLEDINKEQKQRLKTAAESQFKKEDPALQAAREVAMTKEIADLEFQYRLAHNNKLNEAAREDIKKQVEEKYALEGEAVGKLAADYVKKLKEEQLKRDNPKLAQAREEQKVKRLAELERIARLENDGLLTLERESAIKAQVDQEFELTEDNLKRINALYQQQAQKKFKEDEQQEAKAQFNKANPAAGVALETEKARFIEKEAAKLRRENNRLLTKEERKALEEHAETEFKLSEHNLKQLQKIQEREDNKKKRADVVKTDQEIANAVQLNNFSKENNLLSRIDTLKSIVDSVDNENKTKATFAVALKSISDIAKQLELTVDKVALYKGDIDTRLQGSNNEKSSGSYWNQLTKDMMSVGAVTPFFKQEKFAENIKSLVDQGIAFDLKQRAFLMTIQEKIATTFDVADGTLLRLIRIQQEDSTAGRLGMESALNTFLNNMYENTEYLKTVAAGVRSSLQEMEALMSGAEAAEVEYQVQKWMGSLYSVGMSQEAVSSIASALGQIAAGQVDALTNGNGAGNLLVMAANEAGKSISEILVKGLTATETNDLLQATVNYLAELAESSKDNRVVQQQLANVFGVKASDLKAAINLKSYDNKDSTANIYGELLSYDNMLDQLNKMAGTMAQRTSLGERMTNVWANGQYTLASSMANNPAAYLMYKMASLLDATTGGIAIPFISAAGFGVDLETTVADLMRVASISTGVIGSLGDMISGLASSFKGQAMLTAMGIEKGSGLKITPRGTGDGIGASEAGGGQKTTSNSGYVGNASGSDIKNSTIQEAEDTKKQQMIEALEEEPTHQIDYINANVLKIYELLDEVANGKRSLSVKVAGYGLTNLGSNTSLSSAQGGVSGLLNNNSANSHGSNSLGGGFGNSGFGGSGSASGSSASGSGSNSVSSNSGSSSGFGVGTGIDLGGWTMM